MSGTFSNLIREVFSYWFVRALLYPKMTPRTYNLFTVFVVFKRRKKRKSEVRTRRRKRRRILENGWGFVHHRRLEKEGKKGISPVGILLERACREWHLAQKNAKHTSRVTFYAFAQSSILRIDRVLLSLSLSHPNKKFALCASKISSSPSSKRTPKRTMRRETRNATASLLKPIINNAYNYSYLHGCLLSFGIF